MEQYEKEKFVNKILSGITRCKVGGEVYIYKSPSPRAVYESYEIYEEILQEYKFDFTILHDNRKLDILLLKGIWPFDGDKHLKDMEKRMEDIKAFMYKNYLRTTEVEKSREELRIIENRYQALSTKKCCLDEFTDYGFALLHKQYYLYSKSIYCRGKRVWKNYLDINTELLDRVLSKMHSQMISPEQYREIARTDPWRSIWGSKKQTVFKGLLTDEQRALCLYSKMYDNAYKSSECPEDRVIEDDDLFDGWLITQKREREQSTKEKYGNKSFHEGHDTVFVPAANAEEARRIIDQNDMSTKIVLAQRRKQLEARGEVKEGEFADQKLEMQTEARRKFIEQVKGK